MKVLISQGFGAGWSTWCSGPIERFVLTYKPIIDFIEQGGEFTRAECQLNLGHFGEAKKSVEEERSTLHPLLRELYEYCDEHYPNDHLCVLGGPGLVVREIYGNFIVNEYDGAESIQTQNNTDWIHGD